MKKNGFTLIELLSVISLFGILAALSTPYLFGTLEKRRLLAERDKVVSVLKTAQQQSRIAEGGESYGVQFLPKSLITQPQNQSTQLSKSISRLDSNVDEIYFQKLSGEPLLPDTVSDVQLEIFSKEFQTGIRIHSTGVIETTQIVRY